MGAECKYGGESAVTGHKAAAVIGDEVVARLTAHSVNATTSASVWGDSQTGSYTARKGARRDCTGSLSGKLDSDEPIYEIAPSDEGIEQLHEKLVLFQTDTAKDYWHFPCALMTDFQSSFNVDTKEVVEISLSFGADGRFYRPKESGAPAETYPS